MKNSKALVTLVAVALVAGACGGRTGGGATASTSPLATTGVVEATAGATLATDAPTTTIGISDPGVTDDTIKIGGSATLSGPTASIGIEAVGAAGAYFDLINQRGGINGRKIDFITYDDLGDSTQYLANVKKLIEQDKVVALVTGFGDAAVEYIASQGTPTITFGVSPATFSSKYPTIYPVVGNALLWTQETIAALQEASVVQPGMKVGVIYDDTLIDISPYVPAIKQSWENVGAKVVSTDVMSLATGSCDSLVFKMKDLDIYYWDVQSAAWFLCVQAADRQGWAPKLGWGGWPASVPITATVAGPLVEGVWAGSNGDQPDGAPRGLTEATTEFVQTISAFNPELADPMRLESPATLGYWAGAKLLVAALEAQGDVINKDGLNAWIQGVKNFETGVTPPIISMTPDCKTGSELVWIAQWHWDAANQKAVRTAGDYFTSPQKEAFGGECFLTALSDEILGG